MSRYLSHLAALTLNRVEPVQPRLASRFEAPVDRGSSDHNGLDVAQESRISVPPVNVQPTTVIVTDSPDPLKIMPQRLANRFEMPVDRGPSDNNSLNVALESRVAPSSTHVQTLRNDVTAEDRLDRVKPVRPHLSSQLETTVNIDPSGKNGLDVALESRLAVPPANRQSSTNTALDSPNRMEPVQPRLASRFEIPVKRGSSDNNGLDIAKESRVVTPANVQSSQVTATNSSDHVKPRLNSRFEMPVDKGPSDNNGLDVAEESRVVPPAHVQPSTVTATDNTVVQGIVITSADGQAKKKSRGQDQPKVIEPTEFKIKESELPRETQKLSSDQSFASLNTMVDTAKASRAAQIVNNPVAQTSYDIRKDALPTENVRTLVERVQERFTETTHSELVIKEVAVPNANKKISNLEESPRVAPVKPASIVVRPEQSTAKPKAAAQAGIQSLSSAHSGTDSTPAPTIHVTIGRIEIRATQVADKPIARPRAASTAMSLDDYLKQRESKART